MVIDPTLLFNIYKDLDSILKEERKNTLIDKVCLCNKTLNDQEYTDIYYNTEGYRCCYICGYVYDSVNIDYSAEWNNYTNNDNNTNSNDNIRCAYVYKNLKGNDILGTFIGNNNSNNYIGNKWNNLKKMQMYCHNDSNIEYKKINEIKQLLTELNINTDITQMVIKDYFSFNKIYRGNIKLSIIAALTYLNYKKINQIKTLKSLSVLFNIELQSISKALDEIIQEFNNSTYIGDLDKYNYTFIESFCKSLSIFNNNIINAIKNIFKTCIDLGICNSSTPQALSSSIILFVCNKKKILIDNNLLTKISGLTVYTIKKYYKELENNEQMIYNYIQQNKTKTNQ